MIEKTLERIATALETIAASVKATPVEAPPAAVEAPPAAVEAPPAAVEAPPAPPVTPLSLEEFNTALVVEYRRLGNDRAPIETAFTAAGAKNASELSPEKYNEVLQSIQSLPAA